jgi:cytochrome c
MRSLVVAVLYIAASASTALAQDVAAGEASFRKCAPCHGVGEDAANKVGIFKEYIRDPRAKVPGTKMIFAGIKNDKELDDLWGYLKQFAADGRKK